MDTARTPAAEPPTEPADPSAALPVLMHGPVGGQGQAAAFRPALDLQAIQRDPLLATGDPFDATMPIDATALRAALADGARARNVPVTFAVPATPAVVAPQSVQRAGSAHPARPETRTAARAHDPRRPQPDPQDPSPRHSRGDGPYRLRTTVGISALLAAAAGIVLVLTTGGMSRSPFAPSALPGVRTSAKPSPLPVPTPHHSAPVSAGTDRSGATTGGVAPGPGSASAGQSVGTAGGASPREVPSPPQTKPPGMPPTGFVTLGLGDTTPSSEIDFVQVTLVQLHLLRSLDGGKQYRFDHSHTDPSGTYGEATQDAVHLFQQMHDLPVGPCDQKTFNLLLAQPRF